MTPMPPVSPSPPAAAEPAAEPARLSAFQTDHGQGLFADPSEMGRSILASLDGFQAQAIHVRSLTRTMQAGPAASPASPEPVTAAGGAAAPAPGAQGQAAERQHMLGVMLETFDFAMQTEMVTRAATTFTSSVNTLIKAQ